MILSIIHHQFTENFTSTYFYLQKCFTFDPDENIWDNKRMVLEEFSEQLYDPLNYGLYLPPTGGKAGKFLDEERPLDDYKLQGKLNHTKYTTVTISV